MDHVQEPKSKQNEETIVVISPQELKVMTRDIKRDIEKQDQGKDDFKTKSNAIIARRAPKMDSMSEEIQDGPGFLL